MKTTNIMIVGVGGQGSLLASKLLGRLLVDEGYDVKVSEVHGMSQRGGSVVTYVRFGEKVCSSHGRISPDKTSAPDRLRQKHGSRYWSADGNIQDRSDAVHGGTAGRRVPVSGIPSELDAADCYRSSR